MQWWVSSFGLGHGFLNTGDHGLCAACNSLVSNYVSGATPFLVLSAAPSPGLDISVTGMKWHPCFSFRHTLSRPLVSFGGCKTARSISLGKVKQGIRDKEYHIIIRQNEQDHIRIRCLHLRRSSIYSYLPQHCAN
jgi:hypothetical protein